MLKCMIAAFGSGSGKTVLSCGLLALMKRKGLNPCAFKCGPDYIDPMFHRTVLGVQSHNLDLFLSGGSRERIRAQYSRYLAGHGAAVTEGVMGYYDGLGGTTDQGSAWDLADTLDLPVLLTVRPGGSSLTLAAQIRGLLAFRENSHIRGIVLSCCKESYYRAMGPMLERETGLPVLGYLPPMEEAEFESRHLGLLTAGEIGGLAGRLDRIGARLEETLDWERFRAIFERKEAAEPAGARESAAPLVRIAVASDEAFCFIYRETLDLLRDLGAEPVFFSPLKDRRMPEGCGGLLLSGGYPELHAEALSENIGMRESIAAAVRDGMPCVAECGGFLYLQEALEDAHGRAWPMAGVLPGRARNTGGLVRFGYAKLHAGEDSLLFRRGEEIPVHEFHYLDSTDNGSSLRAVKAGGTREWRCCTATKTLYAGFPHLYMAGKPELAERFAEAASRYAGKAAAMALAEETSRP